MPQSLSKLYVHIIFHTKYNQPMILPEVEKDLYAYIGGIIKENQSIPIKIGGVKDHLHILAAMSKNISLAKFVEEIKRNSSRWIKTKGSEYKNFAWQGGYAGFSVSPSVLDRVVRYIENQKIHHQKQSFQSEYLQFLEEHQIDFDEDFLWK
ncbi:IS200/IS605 family transposase [Moheibacter stercoris]|uniref:REP element-mobilizing transposase RayT n=1 Tax=Moheibacter stercoris TaxID=1628251 RepID=A0ABV2LT97_9FLAO